MNYRMVSKCVDQMLDSPGLDPLQPGFAFLMFPRGIEKQQWAVMG